MTAWRQAQLGALSPYQRNILDYKLGLLTRIGECLGGTWSAEGVVNMVFHFDVDADNLVGVGTKAELYSSTIAPSADPQLLACAKGAHRDQQLVLPVPATGEYGEKHYWGAQIKFPLGRDNAYGFFAM